MSVPVAGTVYISEQDRDTKEKVKFFRSINKRDGQGTEAKLWLCLVRRLAILRNTM